MASVYYEHGRERYPRTDELWLEPPGNLFRDDRVDERPAVFGPVLSLPRHNGVGAFAVTAPVAYSSPMTDSSRYSLNSSLLDSVGARSPGSSEPVLVSRDATTSGSFASWQDVGTLAVTPADQHQLSMEPSDEVWQWSVNSSQPGEASDWTSPSFPSSFTFITGSDSRPSGTDSLEMSIDSEHWRRVRARSRNVSASTLSRAEAEASLARRKQLDSVDQVKETFWEALLRTLLMLDGATVRLLKGGEGGSLFFDGKEAPLRVEPTFLPDDAPKQPEQRALTTFLSHVASSLSPACALKRGLSVLPVRQTPSPPSATTSPKSHAKDVKPASSWMASTAGAVAWYALSALPLLISLEAGGKVWRVWRRVEASDA